MATLFKSLGFEQTGIDDFIYASYSQFGEDSIIDHIFRYSYPVSGSGFYIDVGAHHPRFLSNTAILYMKGWRGINIDANPGSVNALANERPRDICIAAGVAREHGHLPFFRFEGGAISSFDPAARDLWVANGHELAETRMTTVAPLKDLLKPHLSLGTKVDYLNIDIEGLDMEALETYDFDNFAPTVISVECHGLDLHNLDRNAAFRFLSRLGYRLVSHAIVTSIYMR